MKKYCYVIVLVAAVITLLQGCSFFSKKARILVFTKTTGFRHESIAAGVDAIYKLGKENNFDVDTTSDSYWFTEDTLKHYAAVVFLDNTDNNDNLLNIYQKIDFQRYIEAGGGFAGIHGASDAGYHWGWYQRLVGATFVSHPEQQQASLEVVDANHPSTKSLPAKWSRKDEWYNFKNVNKDVHVLLKIDEKSYKGGTMNGDHPMAWYHEYDGGRAWYTELGHTEESFKDPTFLMHLLGGIQYAIGENDGVNYNRAKTERTPEEDRFTKTQLVTGSFYEPTEMTILPNLDVLVVQRRGEMMLYKNSDHSVKQVGFLNVYFKSSTAGSNAEEGLLGVQKDPDFEKNHFVYAYYSPIDTSVNRLSRFTLENDTIDIKSEKIILQLYSQREICCHTGGSIAFGKDRTLFVSTGDNSTPFDEPKQTYVNHGFGPMNDEPGASHLQYDARRSSGNTNDLRGKILRIHVNEDGTYSIPKGNLFPGNNPKTKPEIYVMGNRNPYRISVDQKNGFLYWGEVGPDANDDSLETRGSKGYDELNQARNAGYFGWPLFVGNNYPYRAYDYATGKSGEPFDPKKPINNSRNNTGLTELPPVQPAFIWYPYGESKDFPQVGSGGRTAMAGPVYYPDLYPEKTRMPEYYNGKLFWYDWVRGWIKVVTMQPNGDLDNLEPFMAGTKFNAPVDMEVGPDGRIYVLEYGNGWFSKNADAGLARLDYNAGNRPPVIASVTVDKTSGLPPLKFTATVVARDPDNDKLSYTWSLGNGTKVETKEPKLEYTLAKAGDYNISVEVKDDKGAVAKSSETNVYAGNIAPEVSIDIEGNKTFYFPGEPVKYKVVVEDKDDTAKVKDVNDYIISADYVEGTDMAAATRGHQVLTEAMMGKNLMLTLDCKACHKIDDKSAGPSFTSVAQRYAKDVKAMDYLSHKIINGGSGVWGETKMSAHPNLKEADAKQIVTWVLSLSGDKKVKSLPVAGTVNASLDKPVKDKGLLTITAMYTDKGSANTKPLTGTAGIALRNNKLTSDDINTMEGFSKESDNGVNYLTIKQDTAWFATDSVDVSGLMSALVTFSWTKAANKCVVEIHLDSPDGKKLGEGILEEVVSKLPAPVRSGKTVIIKLGSGGESGYHKLYFVTHAGGTDDEKPLAVSSVIFSNK